MKSMSCSRIVCTHRYGKIDWLESNNEYWLFQDAKLRQDFNITTGDKADDVMHYKLKSEMKAYYHKANVPTARLSYCFYFRCE